MKRRISLYGRLRDHSDHLVVDLPRRATARQTLRALAAVLGPDARLLKAAVLATADSVLRPDDVIPEKGTLALLPPVCGG